MTFHLLEVNALDEDAKAKIRSLSQNDIPITERRALYNHMGRRFRNPSGLKPGLLEKYQACQSNHKERFKLLKEFLISEDMFCPYCIYGIAANEQLMLIFFLECSSLTDNSFFKTHNFRGKRPMSKPTLSSQALG